MGTDRFGDLLRPICDVGRFTEPPFATQKENPQQWQGDGSSKRRQTYVSLCQCGPSCQDATHARAGLPVTLAGHLALQRTTTALQRLVSFYFAPICFQPSKMIPKMSQVGFQVDELTCFVTHGG